MLKKISLLVCTNRPNQPFARIWKSIIDNSHLQKVILATQGSAINYVNKEQQVIHLPLKNKGRSRAVNCGLQEISSFAIGLTDDDCVIQKNWLNEAIKILKNPEIDLVYGQTKPYKPQLNKNKFCPSTFSKKPNNFSITSHLGKHWLDVGFDNNVVIKNKVFQNIGGYKWWIGPGCLIPAAEDAEFTLRALLAGYKIAYNPKMIVYHDRFLNKKDFQKQSEIYAFGGLVVYGFYAFQGVCECKTIFNEYLFYFFYGSKKDLKMFLQESHSFKNLRNFFHKIHLLLKGIFYAFLFAKIISIPVKENVVKRFYKRKNLS